MKKAIVKISEGLGNQLFMFANAYSFSKKMGYDLYVDSKTAYKKLKIRNFLLDNLMIDLDIADEEDIPNNFSKYAIHKLSKKIDFLRKKKKFLIEKKFNEKITSFEDYTKIDYSNKVYIEGYFESEKYSAFAPRASQAVPGPQGPRLSAPHASNWSKKVARSSLEGRYVGTQ